MTQFNSKNSWRDCSIWKFLNREWIQPLLNQRRIEMARNSKIKRILPFDDHIRWRHCSRILHTSIWRGIRKHQVLHIWAAFVRTLWVIGSNPLLEVGQGLSLLHVLRFEPFCLRSNHPKVQLWFEHLWPKKSPQDARSHSLTRCRIFSLINQTWSLVRCGYWLYSMQLTKCRNLLYSMQLTIVGHNGS